MREELDVRLRILKQAAECTGSLAWEDTLCNDIATQLIVDEFVRGEVTEGGAAIITGVWDKGREEIERHGVRGKAKHISKRLAILICTGIVTVVAYILQLDAVKSRLSELIDSILK